MKRRPWGENLYDDLRFSGIIYGVTVNCAALRRWTLLLFPLTRFLMNVAARIVINPVEDPDWWFMTKFMAHVNVQRSARISFSLILHELKSSSVSCNSHAHFPVSDHRRPLNLFKHFALKLHHESCKLSSIVGEGSGGVEVKQRRAAGVWAGTRRRGVEKSRRKGS